MDRCTFGNSGAAVNLMGILDKPENSLYARKASKILSKYLDSLKALSFIPHKETRETAYIIWRNRFLEWVDSVGFPIVVETHLKCVIVGQCRKYLKEISNK